MTDTARKPNAPDVSRISHKPKLVIIDGYGLLLRAYRPRGP
jgi:hypothetical protein